MLISPEPGLIRPESSVTCALDEFGEPNFPNCAHSAVIHRTPEELGLPRVVAGAPEPRALDGEEKERNYRAARAEAARLHRNVVERDQAEKRGAGLRAARRARRGMKGRMRLEAPLRVIRGVEVRMPADAVIGAEMIDGFAEEERERGRGEEGMTLAGYDMTTEANRKIAAAPLETPAAELAARIGVPVSRVYGVRSQLYKEGRLRKPSASEIGASAHRNRAGRRPKPAKESQGATSRVASGSAKPEGNGKLHLDLEMSAAELAEFIVNLAPEQQAAFFRAGFRAAVLA